MEVLLLYFVRYVHVYMKSTPNKNKRKEKQVENIEKLVNKVSTELIHQFRIYRFWEKYARQLCSIRMYKSKVNYFFTILWYTFSKRYPEQRIAKWVTAKDDRLRK